MVQPDGRRWLALLLTAVLSLAGFVLVSVVVYALFFPAVDEVYALGGPLMPMLIVGAPLVWGGRVLIRSHAVRADQAMRADTRPPVLLLRSFRNEDIRAPIIRQKFGLLEQLFARDPRLEEVLAGPLSVIGPFVTVQRPGTLLPELGAARVRVDEDKWKTWVLEHLERAQLVVIATGTSPGLAWELQQVFEQKPLHQVLLVFSGSGLLDGAERVAHYEAFRTTFGPLLPVDLPPAHPDAVLLAWDSTGAAWLFGASDDAPRSMRGLIALIGALHMVSGAWRAHVEAVRQRGEFAHFLTRVLRASLIERLFLSLVVVFPLGMVIDLALVFGYDMGDVDLAMVTLVCGVATWPIYLQVAWTWGVRRGLQLHAGELERGRAVKWPLGRTGAPAGGGPGDPTTGGDGAGLGDAGP